MDEILRMIEEMGWDHDAGTYGLDFNLTCPCGHTIEQDGTCPDGCVSPLRTMGLI